MLTFSIITVFPAEAAQHRDTAKQSKDLSVLASNAASNHNSLMNNAATKQSEAETARSGPNFDATASKNVTALLGKTAYLNCRVKNLGNKTVSIKKVLISFFFL